jgi:hypothetical protein
MPDENRSPAADDDEGESRDDKLNRELIELLNELRVALPGVQVLFAFLLTIPFTGTFRDLSELQTDVYFGTFCTTMAATAFLMAPTAYHRLRWRRRDKERMLQIANKLSIAGLAALAFAIAGSAFLIADLLFGATGAIVTVSVTAGVIVSLWFLLPLTREATDRES